MVLLLCMLLFGLAVGRGVDDRDIREGLFMGPLLLLFKNDPAFVGVGPIVSDPVFP